MVEEGALHGADAAFALHVWPTLPAGMLATRPGPIMAGVLSFEATVRVGECGGQKGARQQQRPIMAGVLSFEATVRGGTGTRYR